MYNYKYNMFNLKFTEEATEILAEKIADRIINRAADIFFVTASATLVLSVGCYLVHDYFETRKGRF
jgi:hypothetical protein